MGILTELSDEQLSKTQEALLSAEPHSGDIQEALMNRISALERRIASLEVIQDLSYGL